MHSSQPLSSRKITRNLTVAFIVGASLLSAACGLKDQLRLPEGKAQEAKRQKQPIPVRPSPQSQKQDRIDSAGETTTPKPAVDPDRPATTPPQGP